MALVVKNPPANAGDLRDPGSIPESGRSCRGTHGNPLQYSCLENPMDRKNIVDYSSVQFSSVLSSVTQLCLTLCDPMNHSMPGLPVHHQLLEFTQTQVHRVGDAIQPSHSLSSPSPTAPNPSQHQGLFQWVKWGGQSIRVSASASVLPMNTQDWYPLGWTGWISSQSKGLHQYHSSKASILQHSALFFDWVNYFFGI